MRPYHELLAEDVINYLARWSERRERDDMDRTTVCCTWAVRSDLDIDRAVCCTVNKQ